MSRPLITAGLLFAGLAVLAFIGLDQPFGNGDEIIYAQNLREMKASGDWGVLVWQGAETHMRPTTPFVLAHWGELAIGGELGMRLPMALCSLMTLAFVYWGGFLLSRRHGIAALGVLLCASVPSYFLFSRALLSDPAFVAMTTLALVGTIWAQDDRHGLIIAALGLGGAVACKSVAAGIPGLAMAPWLILAARKHRSIRTVAIALGCFLLLALPYFIYGGIRFGGEFFDEHLGANLGNRLKGSLVKVGMPGGPEAYLSYVWRADGPLSVVWLAATFIGALFLLRRKSAERRVLIPIAVGVASFVILSLVATRLPHYILPVYPALAIGAAGLMGKLHGELVALQRPLVGVAAGSLAVGVLLLGVASPPDDHLLPDPLSVHLGKRAAEVRGDAKVYTLDWYAPAFGYYSGDEWRALFSDVQMAERFGGIYIFRKAGNVQAVPPWPDGEYFLAGPLERMHKLGVRGELVEELAGFGLLRIPR